MGTPDIAATCLKKILADGFDVVGVYTQPDRPKGRGMKLVASPVKEVAVAAGIPVFQPENFREEETVEQLRALQPDICAVVAYGRILPQKVLDVPKYGCINIHASLLPKYRGSAPYQWAVLDGLPENITITSAEVRDGLGEPLSRVIEAIKITLEKTPPELSADIIDQGITLAGGGALLRGLDKLINRETGMPVYVAEYPLDCVAEGTGRILENLEKYRDLLTEEVRYY